MTNEKEILEKYGKMVIRIAFTNVRNISDAEDTAQDVFLSLLVKRPYFESEAHQKAWLIRATINRCKNYTKSKWFSRTEPLSDTLNYLLPEESEVLAAVLALPQNYRNMIHLYYYEGYSINDISGLLRKNPATIGTWLSRGRQALKITLKGGFDNE
jgi:RNA polymerase sigma factor (sigma-70 family)